jgi:hypothetical protein
MYHRYRIQTLLLTLLFASFLFAPVSVAATDPVKAPYTGAVTVSGEPAWPMPPSVKLLKKRPHGVEVYQYDNSPIGNRQPLVMVHGLLGEYWDCFRWKKLVSHLQSDPEFSKRFKVVFLRYDSKLPLNDVVPAFKKAALEVSNAFHGQPLNMVALSMGGNLLPFSMTDAKFDERIKSVMTMGTPFHGSPLFTSNWMEYSMLRHYRSPISRLDTALPYRLYFNRHKNLLSDLHWDNSDAMIPDVGDFRYFFPVAARGTLSPSSTANTAVAKLNESLAVDKSKFTVYGGYLMNEFAMTKGPNEFASILKIPYRFTFTLVPEHFGREHPVLRALNQHIARAIVSSPQDLKAEGVRFAYGLNDGIAPITSTLFLPNSALAGLAPTDANAASLAKLVDVKRARLFRNIDHLTFIDDYHPLRASAELRDQFAPDLPARGIFDWIKGDLMETAPSTASR